LILCEINCAALVSLTASSIGLMEDVGTFTLGIGVFRNHRLAGSTKAPCITKISDALSRERPLIGFQKVGRLVGRKEQFGSISAEKKRGATGITTAAPHIAGQWGRGE
jgi:hypothetical protein